MNQEKKYKRFTYRSVINLAYIMIIVMLGSSCNKDFPDKLNAEYGNDTVGINHKERKVLYLILDGVNGGVLQNLEPPNITSVFRNSIYSYGSLTDFDNISISNANAWANMLTGVGVDKHNVKTEDFANNQLQTYQSVFSKLKQHNAKMRTVSIASSGSFNENLAIDATVKTTFENDDAAVKGNLILELKNNNAGFLVAQFHGAELAGQSSGYDNTSTDYISAIQKLDGYIGEILKTLSNRNKSKEDWLVVLASNKGGITNGQSVTAYGDVSRNNFIAFYNPKFIAQFIPKPDADEIPYVGSAPNFNGNNTTNNPGVLSDPNMYNFGLNGSFTFQMKVRIDHAQSQYPPIAGKREKFDSTKPGWLIYTSLNSWTLNICAGKGNISVFGGSAIMDKTWHTLAFKIYIEGGKRWAKTFTDGVLVTTASLSGYENIDSTFPLTLGHIFASENRSIDVLIKEVQLFNLALSDQVIIDYTRKVSIDNTHPNYNNLIGYWPCNEGAGNVIEDKSGKGKDFMFAGVARWKSFNDYSQFIDPSVSSSFYKSVPNSVDIPFQIYQWMGINVPENWDLKGKSWKVLYSDTKL